MASMMDEAFMKLVQAMAGEDGIKVVKCLLNHGEITDDEIALEIGIKPNDVRKILYRFVNSGLLAVNRLRDEKTGWYTFKWRLQLDQMEGFIASQKRRILHRLQQRLNYEEGHKFYQCGSQSSDCPRLTFEEAMESNFLCPKCGSPLQFTDNQNIINALRERIEALKAELG
ncbi:MAG: transcription factor [Candidatus Bathyarchaeia archaeon]